VLAHNPDAEHHYWSDGDLAAFFSTTYPHLLAAFRTARVGVQRSDLGRLAVLHHFGGLYIDLDVECRRPFDAPLVGADRLTVAPEPQAQVDALYGAGQVYLCNAVMFAPPGDAVISACLAHIGNLWHTRGPAMWATSFDLLGGKLLTRMWQDRPTAVNVLSPTVCYPFNDLKLRFLPTHAADVTMARTGTFSEETQAVHWWVHSNFEGRDLINTHVSAWEFLAALYSLA